MESKVIFDDLKDTDAFELACLDKICLHEAWSEEAFLNDAKNENAKYVIARLDGKIIGYCGLWIVAGEGQITNVAVLPEYRRKGIASQIMERVTEFADKSGIRPITLEVRESNIGAQKLYLKFGFEKIGFRKRFYREPEEGAVLMGRG